ncbi:MAG: type IV toxin-antitoxin system AbiEi family antitoxin [Gammaproteobacteria bacterium]
MTSLSPPDAPAVPGSSTQVLRQLQAQARYVFREQEFAELTGRVPGSPASQLALQRLSKAGLVVLAQKKPAKWLIVPAEQAHYGAPPVDWWLDDFLRDQEPNYYVALLSAARHWGSAHYALQTIQVMVSRPRRPVQVGKLNVEFITKRSLDTTPVSRERTRVAHLRVSTREATVLDLIRHQDAIGGLEAVARVAKDLAPKMTPSGVKDAISSLDQVPAAQRLGFVLQHLGSERLSASVSSWLNKQRKSLQPLVNSQPDAGAVLTDYTWAVEYTPAQLEEIKELGV